MSNGERFAGARVEEESSEEGASKVAPSSSPRQLSVAWAGYGCVVTIGDPLQSSEGGVTTVPVEIQTKTPGGGDGGPTATVPAAEPVPVVRIRALALKGSGLAPTPVVIEMKAPDGGDTGPTVTIRVDA